MCFKEEPIRLFIVKEIQRLWGPQSQTGNSFQWYDSTSWSWSVGKQVTWLSALGRLRFLEVRYATGLLRPQGRLGAHTLGRQKLRTPEGKYCAAPPGRIPSSPGALWDWAMVSRRVGTTNKLLWGLPLCKERGWRASCNQRKPGLENGVLFASPTSNAAIVLRTKLRPYSHQHQGLHCFFDRAKPYTHIAWMTAKEEDCSPHPAGY